MFDSAFVSAGERRTPNAIDVCGCGTSAVYFGHTLLLRRPVVARNRLGPAALPCTIGQPQRTDLSGTVPWLNNARRLPIRLFLHPSLAINGPKAAVGDPRSSKQHLDSIGRRQGGRSPSSACHGHRLLRRPIAGPSLRKKRKFERGRSLPCFGF